MSMKTHVSKIIKDVIESMNMKKGDIMATTAIETLQKELDDAIYWVDFLNRKLEDKESRVLALKEAIAALELQNANN